MERGGNSFVQESIFLFGPKGREISLGVLNAGLYIYEFLRLEMRKVF